MSQSISPATSKTYASHPTGPTLKPRPARWYLPLTLAVGLGFGAYNFYSNAQTRRETAMIEEEKRLAKNRELLDAFGGKESLEDMQQALDAYQTR